MAAVHLRVIGQRGELLQRRVHLLRRALEQPPAAAGEQRVATEQRACSIIGNVRARVAGNVEHGERDAELRHAHPVSFRDRMSERRDRLAARAVGRHVILPAQLGDAADVIGVVVRGEDRRERKLLALQVLEHRARFAGIHDRGVRASTQRPDVVVLERVDRNDRHDASILRA